MGGTKALAAYYEQQKKLPQLNEKDTASAQHLAQAWELLTQKVTVGGQKLLTALDASGLFDKIFASLSHFVDYLDDHQGDIVAWFNESPVSYTHLRIRSPGDTTPVKSFHALTRYSTASARVDTTKARSCLLYTSRCV